MTDYLETTVDKFTFKVARDRLYTRDGLWVRPNETPEGIAVTLGLTDYLQQHSGDAAFANVKPVGTVLNEGDEFAEVETIKVNVGMPSPLSGTIVEVNKQLEMYPEFVNQDPYEKGWLVIVKPDEWDSARSQLLDANSYFDFMRTQIDAELKETS